MFSRDWLMDSDFRKRKVYKYFVEIQDERGITEEEV